MELNEETLTAIAKNDNFKDKELLKELAILFEGRPDVLHFLYLYGEYCECMDDLVDEGNSPERVDKSGQLRMELGQTTYWLKHSHYLWLVERLIHNTYFDTVKWEGAEEEWKRRDAKALSHCAYNMLFSVILLEFGYDKLRELSERFRTHAHERHLHDTV